MKKIYDLKKKSVLFATFAHYEGGKRMSNNGNIDGVTSIFIPKVYKFHMVVQPHPGSDRVHPQIEFYEKGILKKSFYMHPIFYFPIYLLCLLPSREKYGIRLSYKLRDILSVIFVAMYARESYDLFIGLEAIDAIAGMLLKKFGRVKRVVYYVSDYSPKRFKNKLLNDFYLWLDRFCVLHADYTWDVSAEMQKGRIKAGLPAKEKYRVIHVPNGLFPSQIKSLSIAKRRKNHLVYMGILEGDMGPDLAIRSVALVKKKFPDVTFHVIGGPKNIQKDLENLAKDLHIASSVVFYGFVPDNNRMAEIVRSCSIALAPYRAWENSKRWYGDAGKIRQYMAAGLPIVTTNVPPLGHFVVEKGAGIMVKDTEKDFSDGIIALLSDKKLYEKQTKKAIELSRENTWENSYKQAMEKMG